MRTHGRISFADLGDILKLRALLIAVAILVLGATLAPQNAYALESTGTSRWLVLPCRFTNSAATPFVSTDTLQRLFSHNRGLEVYFDELSNGKLGIQSRVQAWKTIPNPSTAYNINDGTAMFEACTAQHNAEVDFNQVDAVLLVIDAKGAAAHLGGSTAKEIALDGKSLSWPYSVMFNGGSLDQGIVAHEMLHAYTLPDGAGQSVDGREDGETFTFHDVMSLPCGMVFKPNTAQRVPEFGCLPGHTRALYKQQLGWIDDANVCTFNPTGPAKQTFRLESSARPLNLENCLMVRIPVPYATGQYFIAEARMKRGFDTPLYKSGVILGRTWGEIWDQNTARFVTTLGPTKQDSLNQTVPDMDATIYESGETFENPDFCFNLSVDEHNASREEQSYTVTVHKTC